MCDAQYFRFACFNQVRTCLIDLLLIDRIFMCTSINCLFNFLYKYRNINVKNLKKQKNSRFCPVLLTRTVSNTAKTRFQIAVCKGQGVPSIETKKLTIFAENFGNYELFCVRTLEIKSSV